MVKIELIILLILMFSNVSFGAETFVIRIKSKTLQKAKEQALKMEQKRLTLVRNTNALCGVEKVAKIGIFEKNLSELDKANYALINEFFKRLKVHDKGELNFKEFEERYFIGDYDVTRDKGYKDMVKDIILGSCNVEKWSDTETVKAWISGQNEELFFNTEIKTAKKTEKNSVLLSRSGCFKAGKLKEKIGHVYDCTIKPYGFVRLTSPW